MLITLDINNVLRYYYVVAIKNFKDKEAQRIFEGKFSKKLPQQIQQRVRIRLIQLHAAIALEDLMLPPSNMLEALHGNRKGQHSIRISKQYRVCFVWQSSDAEDVEIVDYHH